MIWLRKGFVHFLSILLLISLLGMAAATGFRLGPGNPAKVESWLAQSQVYNKITASALNQAQKTGDANGTASSVNLNNPLVRKRAEQAFNPQLLQASVNSFINSNYDWLKGKRSVPASSVNLTGAKENFARMVGNEVTSRLKGLPVCTDQQVAALPVPADPLAIACRPSTLDPKTEGDRVAQEFNQNNDLFGTDSADSADDTTPDTASANEAYYKRLPRAPQIYRIAMNLPWILALLSLILAAGIVFIAPARRRGWRRLGVVLIEAGIVLIVVKFLADTATRRLQGSLAHSPVTSQFQDAINTVVNRTETQLVHNNLWFGAGFILAAAAIFGILIKSRRIQRKPAAQPAAVPAAQTPGTSGMSAAPAPTPMRAPYRPDTGSIRLSPNRGRIADTQASATAKPISTQPESSSSLKPLGKTPPKRKPPRLIQ